MKSPKIVTMIFFFFFQIVQQLVDEHLRALQLTIFDQHFKELKDRIDKIECATKHQTAVNTLQVSQEPNSVNFMESQRKSV